MLPLLKRDVRQCVLFSSVPTRTMYYFCWMHSRSNWNVNFDFNWQIENHNGLPAAMKREHQKVKTHQVWSRFSQNPENFHYVYACCMPGCVSGFCCVVNLNLQIGRIDWNELELEGNELPGALRFRTNWDPSYDNIFCNIYTSLQAFILASKIPLTRTGLKTQNSPPRTPPAASLNLNWASNVNFDPIPPHKRCTTLDNLHSIKMVT